MKTTKKLTAEQAEKLGAEYRALLELAHQQCEEHKEWIRGHLATWDKPHEVTQLIASVDGITMEMVQLEPAMKEGDRPTVTVVYSYPDVLHAWLSRPTVFGGEALAGGITLDEEPPAVKV